MDILNIETPALIIDFDVIQKNSSLMMNAISESRAMLRPHFKSHKCTEIAKFQIENGAKGITVAKISEAEALIKNLSCDILIANQVVEPSKLSRLARLCKDNTITVCVDNEKNVFDLECAMAQENASIGILIEYEIGMKRCGVLTEKDFYNLYLSVMKCPHLKFKGIQAYAGHNSHEINEEKRLKIIEENNKKLNSLIKYLRERGVGIEIISGASTGTAVSKMYQGIYNEIQAGSYLLLDDCYNKMGLPFENSLFVLTTVVSSKENLIVVDAGIKTVGVDQGLPTVSGLSFENIVASEEHFQIHNPTRTFEIGTKLKLIPAHCCSTMNLHDCVYLVRDGKVVKKLSIDGRGFGK